MVTLAATRIMSALVGLLVSFASTSPMPAAPIIDWVACPQGASTAMTCGTLNVPLEYTALAFNKSLPLQLVKINATTQPSKGSIIFDFGGPGNINVDNFVGNNGQALLLMTGGVYDLITFVPRGLGTTIPYSCYNTSADRAAAIAATPQALEAPKNATEAAWVAAGAQSEACYENAGYIGDLIGTSFVARDIMQIVDALDEDGLLRYYGFSYGTIAAMFPDRIDRLLLDGVVNPTEYWNSPSFSFALDTDVTLSAFLTGCIESPELCALAQIDSSAGNLSRQVASLLEDLKVSPLILGADNSTVMVTHGSLKATIVSALYFPATWSSLATMLAAVLERNTSAYVDAEVQDGIQCADKSFRANRLAEILPTLARFKSESWIRGDGDVAIAALQCARWKFASKERYTGTFDNIQTKFPALIVGNSIDPTTPLASARNLSEGLKGSVLLQNNGYGHTTIASPSLCTSKHIREYFISGTLPPEGTVCESVSSTRPFSFDGSYYEAIQSLGSDSKRSVARPEDSADAALFNAVKFFGKRFARIKTGLRAT